MMRIALSCMRLDITMTSLNPRREAESIAHQYALDDRAELAVLWGLSPAEREDLAAGGGWDAIRLNPVKQKPIIQRAMPHWVDPNS
jgi:hypothetical protein